jgi:hypothetical protein
MFLNMPNGRGVIAAPPPRVLSILTCCVAAILLVAGSAQAQGSDGHAERHLVARTLAPAQVPPVLDGRLDDPAWLAADSATAFVQMAPRAGEPASFPTVVRLLYVGATIYVGIRAQDPEPEAIMGRLTRRDRASVSDWLYIAFDSRHDLTTAFVFGVNPRGVKRDFTTVDGQRDDLNWDAVWEVATHTDEAGWSAEFRIPASVLRYASGTDRWGFQAIRIVGRTGEYALWAPYKPDETRKVARFGVLTGMAGLRQPKKLELLPYLAARHGGNQEAARAGNAGVDAKYQVSSDLTLDLTLNPDFGQVEADPSQVNLTVFETFFPEKRPFFLEGAELYRFSLGLGDSEGDREQLFYSRRIGRAPQLPVPSSGTILVRPSATAIPAAAKLSGRLSGGWSLGALAAVTAREEAQIIDTEGQTIQRIVEPRTGYAVVRSQRDAHGGRTRIGAMVTSVHREGVPAGRPLLPGTAYSGGVEVSHRWGAGNWLAAGHLYGSHVRGTPEAILRLQRAPARYFQRPGAPHLSLDSAATHLAGWGAMYQAGKMAGRWRGGFAGQVRSPGVELNELGYLRDADRITSVLWAGYREFRPGRLFRDRGLSLSAWEDRTLGWEQTSANVRLSGDGQFLNFWNAFAAVTYAAGGDDPRALRGGPAVRTLPRIQTSLMVRTDSRRKSVLQASVMLQREKESGGGALHLSQGITAHPVAAAAVSVQTFYARQRDPWQYVGQPAAPNGQIRYLAAELLQHTLGGSARVDWAFSPALTLQVYAQPFVSAGRYEGFKVWENPRAQRYQDRLRRVDAVSLNPGEAQRRIDMDGDEVPDITIPNPDFTLRAFDLNAVARWEFRPGSTLFVAWSHHRSGHEVDGRFRGPRELGDVFSLPGRNVFLVKVSHWINP